ncbi:MAG TPA: sugar phosphate isomerase/epimerase [Acidobacteriaceae bacterium]|nr:sugar phosphate isomerase/epimerase [Acidobacteriaceae bacterium]
MDRRRFLQFSTAAAMPLLTQSLWPEGGRHFPIGLQLSTLVKHKVDQAELVSSLHQIAAIGFQEVEPWHAAYSIPAEQLRQDITGAGMTVSSGHFEYADLTNDFAGQMDYAQKLGLQWVVCPMLPKSQWMSPEGFHTAARQFNDWARRVNEVGMQFAFHNHDYEFRKFDGITGYDILLQETDPKLVYLEMDCYWIAQAGYDPVQMLNRLGHRVRMLHIKDRKPGFPTSYDMSDGSSHFTEIGTGGIDWPAVLAVAKKLDVRHYFIEQDRIEGPPIDSLRASYTYLRKVLA